MPKPADRIHGHRKRPVSATPAALPEPSNPAPNTEWQPTTQEAWRVYWASDLVRIVLSVDLPSITRLFDLYDQHHRSMDVVRQALVVRGSTGQLRTNPLADHALKLEGAILRLENELGLTPMARTRLGITVAKPKVDAAVEDDADDPYKRLRVVS